MANHSFQLGKKWKYVEISKGHYSYSLIFDIACCWRLECYEIFSFPFKVATISTDFILFKPPANKEKPPANKT